MSASPMHTSLLLCSWPVTSLATPRRLPSAPEHRLCVALDPLAGLKQQQSGGWYNSRPPATSGAPTGASDLALEFLPPFLHPGSSPAGSLSALPPILSPCLCVPKLNFPPPVYTLILLPAPSTPQPAVSSSEYQVFFFLTGCHIYWGCRGGYWR